MRRGTVLRSLMFGTCWLLLPSGGICPNSTCTYEHGVPSHLSSPALLPTLMSLLLPACLQGTPPLEAFTTLPTNSPCKATKSFSEVGHAAAPASLPCRHQFSVPWWRPPSRLHARHVK